MRALLQFVAAEPEARARLDGAPLSALTAGAVVGGVEALLYARICKGHTGGIEELLPSLMYFAVLPYEGHEAASEELGLA